MLRLPQLEVGGPLVIVWLLFLVLVLLVVASVSLHVERGPWQDRLLVAGIAGLVMLMLVSRWVGWL